MMVVVSLDYASIIENLENDDENLRQIAHEQLRNTKEQRQAFLQCNDHLYVMLRRYQRQPFQFIPILHTLQSMFSIVENVSDFCAKHGAEFVLLCFDTIFNERLETPVRVQTANTLVSAASVNDEMRVIMRESRGLRRILELTKSSDVPLQRMGTSLLQVFSLNESNRTCVPELNGIEIVFGAMMQNDPYVIQSAAGILHSLMLNHPRNTERISQQVSIRPLLECVLNALNGGVIISEFAVTLEKILFILDSVAQRGDRHRDIYHPNMNIDTLALLLSLVTFLNQFQLKYHRCLEYIFSIIKHLLVASEQNRDVIVDLVKQQGHDKTYFYAYASQSLNGAYLLFWKLLTKDYQFISLAMPLYIEFTKKEPVQMFQMIKGPEGIFMLTDVIKLAHSTTLQKIQLTELLSTILSDDRNRLALKKEQSSTKILAETVFYLLDFSEKAKEDYISKMQFSTFQLLCYLDMNDADLIGKCMSVLEQKVPVHRICDWIIRLNSDRDNFQDKLLFVFMEAIRNLVDLEAVSGYDLVYYGLSPLLVDMIKNPLFKEIVLYLLAMLTSNSDIKDHFIRAGGFNSLLPVFEDTDETVLDNAMKIAVNVCERNPLAQIAFAEMQGIDKILHIIQTPVADQDSNELKRVYGGKVNALVLLNVLLEHEMNAVYASAIGIVQILLPLCSSKSSQLVQQVTLALKQVSHLRANKKKLSQDPSLINLLECQNTDIQENICNILSSVATNDECRRNMMANHAIEKLHDLLESEETYICLLAQMVLGHFKDVQSDTLREKAMKAIAQTDIDFEQKKADIVQKYAKPYATMISRSSIRASATTAYDNLSIDINWDYFDKLLSDFQKRSALHLFKKTLWENLRNSVTKYCDQSAYHSQALLYTTKNIVVQFADTSSVKYEAPPTAARVPSGGTLYYNVGFDEMSTMSIVDFVVYLNGIFAEAIKKMKRQSTIPLQDAEKLLSSPTNSALREARIHPITVLRQSAKDAANGPLQLNAMVKLIYNSPFYKMNKHDEDALTVMFRQVFSMSERLIKGYRVVQMNTDGFKQERFLVITDQSYATIKYDFSKKEVDRKYTTRINLTDLHIIDIGTFAKRHSELYLALHVKQKSSELLLNSSDTNKQEESQSYANVARPSTENCMLNLIIPPYSYDKRIELLLLREIAWVLYAAASLSKGEEMREPFERRTMEKPSSGKMRAFIYNKFKFGAL